MYNCLIFSQIELPTKLDYIRLSYSLMNQVRFFLKTRSLSFRFSKLLWYTLFAYIEHIHDKIPYIWRLVRFQSERSLPIRWSRSTPRGTAQGSFSNIGTVVEEKANFETVKDIRAGIAESLRTSSQCSRGIHRPVDSNSMHGPVTRGLALSTTMRLSSECRCSNGLENKHNF